MTQTLHVCQQRAQFSLRIFVVLVDGKAESIFEPRLGFGAATELNERFTQQDAGHHPLGFAGGTELKMRHGFRRTALGDQRLRETETK